MSFPDDLIRKLQRLHTAHEEILALPEQERMAYLEEIRSESPELADELKKLLEVQDDPSMEEPLSGTDVGNSSTSLSDPDRIGSYRILERIGEGGMGVVYLAEQERPIRRRVALKIIKLGMDTKEVIARFETERQALAMMDHPGVSRVLEAGATDSGRLYFVMEYVPGTTITDYCDRHRLNIQERLELFVGTCRAVHHAHQKGIIHRDLKPSNILVSLHERKPVSKIIDFGVAKATSQRLTEHTFFTEHGKLVGTPEYMSPEQAEMSGLNVDTSTDIYSLGVLLYELLTGSLPFDSNSMRSSSWSEIQTRIREEDPPPPSTRLKQMDGDGDEIARQRGTETSSLAGVVHGELDWVTLKAMEKDRTRRYASAAELAQDIENYLWNEPVLASPPGTLYRLKKTLAKHKGWVISAGVIVALLTASLLVIAGLYLRSEHARRDAVVERDNADRMGEFLLDMLGSINPYNRSGEEPTIGLMLDRTAEHIASGELDDQPEVAARILLRISNMCRLLGKRAAAEEYSATALAIQEKLFGPSSVEILGALEVHVQANKALGRVEEAFAGNARALAICEEHLAENSSTLADHLSQASIIRNSMGNYAVAESLSAKALAIMDANGSTYTAAWMRLGRATILDDIGRTFEAEQSAREALKMFLEIEGEGLPAVAHSLSHLGDVLAHRGEYARAESLLVESLQIAEAKLGADHPFVAIVLSNLGNVYLRTDGYEEAESSFVRSLAILDGVPGISPTRKTRCFDSLGQLYTTLGQYAKADSLLTLSSHIFEEAPGVTVREQAENKAARARLYRAMGNNRASDSLFAEALAFYDYSGIADHPEAEAIRREIARKTR